MKGMRKISRGSDFGGVMAYVFDGDLDDPRELKGELIGGNMSGRTPQELTDEFNLSKAIRPEVKRPVWHNSLRLPLNEKIDKETWNKIGERYMEKMGFSQHNQRSHNLHDDPEGQHIHVVASRIGLDGSLYLGKNENLRSTKIIAELEVEFGLKITKGPTYDESGKIVMPDKSKVSKAEFEKALRTETEPPRVQLQKLVDQALSGKPTATQFVERLQASGVDVVPNIASTGKLNGFSFGLVGSDVYFSGSKLGDSYKFAQLEKRGLSYDKDRESEFLGQLKECARNAAEHDRVAATIGGVQSSGPGQAGDSGTSRDAEDLRGVDRGTDRAGAGTLAADDSAGPGRGQCDDRVDRESRHPAAEVDESPGGRRESAEVDPGAKIGGERSGVASDAVAPARVDSAQHSDLGGGISSGVEVSDAGFISTGDKATDELLRAAHQGRLKAEREALSRQKKHHAEDLAAAKKRQAELDKPASNRLSMLAGRGVDSTWRELEIQRFAQALGGQKFQVTCTPANAKAETIKKTYTAEQMQDPKVIKDLAHMAARNHQISIQPSDSAGLILLKGLDAKDISKLEAAGLPPAAVVTFAGKSQAWVATGSQMSADERRALTSRIESLVGLEKKAGMAGRMVGFAGASLVSCPGQIAPAAAELLGEIKAEAFEAKAAARLANSIEKEVVVQARDFDDIGGIKSLRKDWLSDRCRDVVADATLFGGQYDPAVIERGVLEAMARQGVKPVQAYRAVFDESPVGRGSEQHAAQAVAQAYTRVALTKEGRDLAGVDLAAESAKRHPELMKRAESRQDSELKAIKAQGKQDGIEEQRMLDAQAEQRAIAVAQAAAEKRARELEDGIIKPK